MTLQESQIHYWAHMLDEAYYSVKGDINYNNPSKTDYENCISYAKSLNGGQPYYGPRVNFHRMSPAFKKQLIWYWLDSTTAGDAAEKIANDDDFAENAIGELEDMFGFGVSYIANAIYDSKRMSNQFKGINLQAKHIPTPQKTDDQPDDQPSETIPEEPVSQTEIGNEQPPIDTMQSTDALSGDVPQDDPVSPPQSFYAGWLLPQEIENIEAIKNNRAKTNRLIAKIRPITFPTMEEVKAWLDKHKRTKDIILSPVKYTANTVGIYTPEEGKDTVDTVLKGAVTPYKQRAFPRFKPRSPSAQREVERMITDVVYRAKKRAADNDYNATRKERNKSRAIDPEIIALRKSQSAKRIAARDELCKALFPEIYDAWKNGETSTVRDQAYAELQARLDFTTPENKKMLGLNEWRKFYDKFAKLRDDALNKLADAYSKHDEDGIAAAVAEYNDVCRQYELESANSGALTKYLSVEKSQEFQPKTYEDLIADMQAMHQQVAENYQYCWDLLSQFSSYL